MNLIFLKKMMAKLKSGIEIKQQVIIPRYKNILNIKDLKNHFRLYFQFSVFFLQTLILFIYNNFFIKGRIL